MQYSFNYIITIHNKENLINEVLEGIKKSAGKNSCIYPVLDGCTDNTEEIINQFQKENPNLQIIKIYENDVHELRAINAVLANISHDENQLNVILQDDVVLNDPFLEEHLESLYNKFPGKLGIVSMRHGGDLSAFLLNKESSIFPIKNYVETVYGHGVSGRLRDLEEGNFIFKEIAIKSPICIPSYLILKAGIPNAVYEPWDDIAYCYTSLESGFKNGVLSVPFVSEKEWGTMRTKKQQTKHDDIVRKNLKIFRNLNNKSLGIFFKNRVIDKNVYQIWSPVNSVYRKARYFSAIKYGARQLIFKAKMFFRK